MSKKYDISEIGSNILSSKGTYILHVDIDGLMFINDTYGYEAGDVAIAETAARIERSKSEDMFFCRTGNDDFVLITRLTDLDKANEIGEKILSFKDNAMSYSSGTFKFSVTVMISKIPESLDEPSALISFVQKEMYDVKARGRDRIHII